MGLSLENRLDVECLDAVIKVGSEGRQVGVNELWLCKLSNLANHGAIFPIFLEFAVLVRTT